MLSTPSAWASGIEASARVRPRSAAISIRQQRSRSTQTPAGRPISTNGRNSMVESRLTWKVNLLSTMEFLPFVLIGLPAGIWVDRLRHHPMLIAADLERTLALASIPLAHALGVLSIAQLYAVAFATSVLTVFFDVAYQSYLPRLVLPEQLVEGNAKLEISNSGASIAEPGLAGLLIQLL